MEREMDTEEVGPELSMIKKNLLSAFAKADSNLDVGEEHMKVFLRIRPLDSEEAEKENQSCLKVVDDNVVFAHAPPESHAYRNKIHGRGKTTHKFTFSRVFPEITSQKEFFDSTMLGFTRDFIDGQNCLVFTYGITSSGKTYTIQGTPHNAGLLPRTLDVLFNSIAERQWEGMDLKPHLFIDVERLSKEQEEAEHKIKDRVMRMRSDEAHDMVTLMGESDQSQINATTCSDSSTAAEADHKDSLDLELLKEVESRVRESTAVSVEDQGQIRFSIWVSFAEIYNEQIYDLLEPIPKKKPVRRPVLKLSEDRQGSPYIKGLKEINVSSADEAYRLLTIGQRNLRVACTRLNHVSSRSHCIFNIKIVRVLDKENPNIARVSMLSLCDLAGSERYSKTLADNERLKEAGNINSSLHTLGRCIDTLRYNQNHRDHPRIIPFRNSKLTRLFQNFFSGRGKAAMVVNVNQCSSMFDETLQVFKFSAIAKQLVLQHMDPPPPPLPALKTKKDRAPTIAWEAPTPRTARKRESELEAASCMPLPDDDDLEDDEDDVKMEVYRSELEELFNQIDQLRNDLVSERREKIFIEMRIREEVVKEMSAQFVEIENRRRERNKEMLERAEERAEKRVQMYIEAQSAKNSRKRRRRDSEDSEEEVVPLTVLQAERCKVQDQQERIQTLEQEVASKDARLCSLETELASLKVLCQQLRQEKTALEFQSASTHRQEAELPSTKSTMSESLTAANEENKQLKAKIAQLEEKINAQGGGRDLDVLSQQQLLEDLGAKLTEFKTMAKEQAEEIESLNEMLNEAGETFQQQREEIETLTEKLQGRDAKLQEQAELIESLQRLVYESKNAMEESDQRLTARQQHIGTLEAETHAQREELVRLKTLAEARPEPTGLQEEVAELKVRLQREEVESLQRENALIHGYTATLDQLEATVKARDQELARLQVDSERAKALERELKGLKEKLATPEKEEMGFLKRLMGKAKGSGEKPVAEENLRREKARLEERLGTTEKEKRGIETKLGAMEKEKRAVERKLLTTEEEKKDAEGKLLTMEKEKRDLETSLEAMSEEKRDAERKLEEMEESKRDLETKLEAMEESKRDLETKLEEMEESKRDLETKLEGIEESKRDVERKLEAMEESKRDVERKLEAVIKDKETQGQLLTSRAAALEATLAEAGRLRDRLADLEDNHSALEQKCEELRMVKHELQTMLDTATASQTDHDQQLQAKLVAATSELSKVTATLSDLQRDFTEQASKTVELQSQMERKASQCDCLQSECSELRKLATAVEDKHRAQIEELQTELTNLRAQLLQTKTALETRSEQQQSRVCAASSQRQTENSSGQEVKRLKEEAAGLREDIEGLEEDLKDKDGRLHRLREELAAAKKELRQKGKTSTPSVEAVSTELAALQERKTKLEVKVKEVEGQKVTAEAMVAEFEAKLRVMEAELEVLRQGSQNHQLQKDQLCDLEATRSDLETKVVKLEAELSAKSATLENATSEFETKMAALQELVDKSSRDLEALRSASKVKVADLETKMADQEAASRKQVEDLEGALARTSAKLEEQSAALLIQIRELEGQGSQLEVDLQAREAELKSARQRIAELETGEKERARAAKDESALLLAEVRSSLHTEKTLHSKTQTELDGARAKLSRLQEELSQLRLAAEEHSVKLGTVLSEKSSLEDKLEAVQKQQETANSELTSSQALNLALEQNLSQLQTSHQALKFELEQAVADERNLEASKTKVAADQDRATAELEDAKGKVNKLLTQISELTSLQEKTEAELKQATAEVLQQKSSKEELRSRCEVASSELETSQAEVGRLQDVLKDLQKQAIAAVEAKENLEKEIADLKSSAEKSLQKSEADNEELQSQLHRQKADSESLHSQIADLQKQLREPTRATSEAQQELSGSKEKSQTQTWEIQTLRNHLQEQEKKSAELQSLLAARERDREASVRTDARQGSAWGSKSPRGREESGIGEAALLDLKGKLVDVRLERDRLRAEVRELRKKTEPSSSLEEDLNKSQQRERTLRQQLQQASATMLEHSARISQLEQQLLEARTATEDVQARLTTCKTEVVAEADSRHEVLQDQLQQLQAEVRRREELLETSRLTIQELRNTLQHEQDKFLIASKDAKANEEMLQMLKTALAEQEETMATQDAVLHSRDQEITLLNTELERLAEQFRAALGERGESGREMRELTRAQARLESEVETLRSSLQSATTEREALNACVAQLTQNADALSEERNQLSEQVGKLTRDKESLNSALQDNNQEIRNLEEALSEKSLMAEQLKQALETKVKHDLEERKREDDTVMGDLKKQIKEKDLQIRKLEKDLREQTEKMSKLEQQDKDRNGEMESWRQERDRLVSGLETVMRKQQSEIKHLKGSSASASSLKELQNQIEEKDEKIRSLQAQLHRLEQGAEGGSTSTPHRPPPRPPQPAPDLESLLTQLESERAGKSEVRQRLRSVQKAKNLVISDLRQANGQLQVELARLQGVDPPVLASPEPEFEEENEENIDTSGHIHIDATPPIAAKALRKSRKRNSSSADVSLDRSQSQSKRKTKRSSVKVKEEPPEQEEDGSVHMATIEEEDRRPSRRAKSAAKGKIENIMHAIQNSPFTRSARKLLDGKESSLETDAPQEAPRGRRVKHKKSLYNPDEPPMAPPFDCAPYEPPEVRANVHGIVMQKLRTRQGTRRQTDM